MKPLTRQVSLWALLVAMLTLGTALPHLLRASGAGVPWQGIVAASSGLALLGAAMIGVITPSITLSMIVLK